MPRTSPLLLPFASLLAACAGPALDPAPVVRGPLPVRNQHPFAQTLLIPRSRRPVTQPEGRFGLALDLAHSSIFEVDSAPLEAVAMDGEITRASARVRYGLGAATDVEVELAALYASSGFLDQWIQTFHDLTGLPNQGRGTVGKDQFRMRLRRNGQLVFSVEEDRVSFADLPVTLTHAVRAEDAQGPAVAVRVAVELPTGSERRGAGNGKLDWAVGSMLERNLGRWTLFGGAGLALPGTPDAFERAGIELSEIVALHIGGEYRWSDRTSLLGQMVWTSPFTNDFTLEEFDREILDLALGAAWDLKGGGRLYAAFEEDLVAATGPDFGVRFGVRWGF